MKSPIDFTLLLDETKGYAVHCSTKEDAEEFIGLSRALYPEMMKAWAPGETNYRQHESETIYTFDSKISGEWRKSRLMYGDVHSAENMGYTVIEFSDIYTMTELEESEMQLDMLFG